MSDVKLLTQEARLPFIHGKYDGQTVRVGYRRRVLAAKRGQDGVKRGLI